MGHLLGDRIGGNGRVNAGERAYSVLRDAIVAAELEPGRRLSENELAEQLGISRTPVREALARLREDRLVAIVPQLGTFVTLISPQAVADAAFVREALECNAVRLTSTRIAADGLEELQAGLMAQERAIEEGEAETFDVLDESFHRTLCENSGHEIAWSLSRRANGHLDRIRRLSLPESGYMAEMLDQHRAIVAAVADADPDRAEKELRRHLHAVLSSLPEIRRIHPEYFEDEEVKSS